MAAPELFAKLGLFVRPGFLDGEARSAARQIAAASAHEAAKVLRGNEDDVLYLDSRRSTVALVDSATKERVRQRFLAVMPEIAAHFGEPLSRCETPKFLVYREGDYFKPHHDSTDRTDAPVTIQRRRVSAVVFLNGQAPAPDAPSYQGGGLVFYGLFGGDRGSAVGLEFEAQPGTLVAFRANTLHEVTPISGGERYTLVTWFS
jgi:SM-20-related protein